MRFRQRHKLHEVVVVMGERQVVLEIGVAIEQHGDVVVELALAFDVDHDAGLAPRLDEHLPLLALRVSVALDDDAADRALARHEILCIVESCDWSVQVRVLLRASPDRAAGADPTRPDCDAGHRRFSALVACELVRIGIEVGRHAERERRVARGLFLRRGAQTETAIDVAM